MSLATIRHSGTFRWLLALALLWPTAPCAAQPSEDPLPALNSGLSLRAFTNFDLVGRLSDDTGAEFRNGAIDIYATSRIAENWRALVELVFENDGSELVTDLERLQLTWDPASEFRITVGRIHNPLVLWNTLHHHGLFLQTPVRKPLMTRWEDEGGLWPVHFVGITAGGTVGRSSRFRYEVGVGNGRGRILDEIQVGADANDSKAVVTVAGFQPGFLRGLEIRVAGYADRIPLPDGAMEERDVTVSSAFEGRGTEARIEWGRMIHSRDGVDHSSTDWYVFGSRRLPGRWSTLRPYVLYEHSMPNRNVVLFQDFHEEKSWSAGMRWDMTDWIALKGEFNRIVHEESHESDAGAHNVPARSAESGVIAALHTGSSAGHNPSISENFVHLQLSISF